MYDYLIVGSGLFGAIFAYEARKRAKSVLVLENREHIGGNCYTKSIENINVHYYGPHVFHTDSKEIFEYMQNFCEFNHFMCATIANHNGKLYNLPFNMNTFYQIFGSKTPKQAQEIIESQRKIITHAPQNLEEQAISLVGRDIYERLIKDYTQKQWGKECSKLPASIIKRLPVRFTFDNNYFNDAYQGIPKGGYTQIFKKLLADCEVLLNTNYLHHRSEFKAKKVIFTGAIDSYFDYKLGELEYRSLRFAHETLDMPNFQGVAVMNFTDNTPYTRIIEHKHFEFGALDSNLTKTIISKEYPQDWDRSKEPYYPINDAKNTALYNEYLTLAKSEPNVVFKGRLGEYKYFDMHDIVKSALKFVKEEFGEMDSINIESKVIESKLDSNHTLAFMHTHEINDSVLNEFYKIEQSGIDCVLLVQNDKGIIEDNGEIVQEKEFNIANNGGGGANPQILRLYRTDAA